MATTAAIATAMIFGFVLENVFTPGTTEIKTTEAVANATGPKNFQASDPLGNVSPPIMVKPKKAEIDATIAAKVRIPLTDSLLNLVVSSLSSFFVAQHLIMQLESVIYLYML